MAMQRAAFQLRKYSWSEDKSAAGKPSYTHVVADNLYLILQGSADVGSRLVMQVVQATTVLVEIDLAYHIDVANNTRRQFLQADRHVTDRQLPTYAVSSGPKLAITHRKEDGRVHRMQAAFVEELNCDRIISLLKVRGMTFVEPQVSNGRNARSTSRPTTASTMLTRNNEPPTKPLFGMQPGAHSSQNRPLFARDELLAPREINADRPNTRDMFAVPHSTLARHQTVHPEQQTIPSNSQYLPAFVKVAQERLSSQSLEHRSDTAVSDQSSIQLTTPQTRNSFVFPNSTTSPLLNTALDMSSEAALQGAYAFTGQHTSLPAQTGHILPQLTSEALESLSVKPSESSKPPSSRGGKRKRVTDEIEPIDDAESDAASMRPPAARPRSSISRSSPRTTNELLHGKKEAQTKQTRSRRPSTAQSRQARQPVEKDRVEENERSSNQPDQHADLLSLDAYAKLDANRREGALQDFIFTMLGDKAFQTLCEDISASWHKLALGI